MGHSCPTPGSEKLLPAYNVEIDDAMLERFVLIAFGYRVDAGRLI